MAKTSMAVSEAGPLFPSVSEDPWRHEHPSWGPAPDLLGLKVREVSSCVIFWQALQSPPAHCSVARSRMMLSPASHLRPLLQRQGT